MTRVVAGRFGGRRLRVPVGATRPTSDRVREALFSGIAAWAQTAGRSAADALVGLSFCDLYAGSGAVGLEAASRGANPVLLVESDRRAAAVIRTNAAALAARVSVRVATVERVVTETALAPFDVVFADPPYAVSDDAVAPVLAALVSHSWLAPRGLVVVERSTRSAEPTWPAALAEGWHRTYGETVLWFRTAAS